MIFSPGARNSRAATDLLKQGHAQVPKVNKQTNRSCGFVWPEAHSEASSIHDFCRSNRRQCHTNSADPRQGHAHFGHPAAMMLAMCYCMNDLEVTFQSDDHKTDLFTMYTYACWSSGIQENAHKVISQLVSAVHKAARYEDRCRNAKEDAELETFVNCTIMQQYLMRGRPPTNLCSMVQD